MVDYTQALLAPSGAALQPGLICDSPPGLGWPFLGLSRCGPLGRYGPFCPCGRSGPSGPLGPFCPFKQLNKLFFNKFKCFVVNLMLYIV